MSDWDHYQRLAQLESDKFPDGIMTAEDIMGVWERHPDFAPGGIYGPDPLPPPRRGTLSGSTDIAFVAWCVAAAVLVFSAVVILLVILTSPVKAASMEYCTLFSREYVRLYVTELPVAQRASEKIDFALQRSYSWCLNQDDDPTLKMPADSVFVGALATTESLSIPVDEVGPTDVSAADTGESGFAARSPEWVAWCKANYRSYAKDGTVRRRGVKGRVLCPG